MRSFNKWDAFVPDSSAPTPQEQSVTWLTHQLSDAPDATSPGGASEIRYGIKLPQGDLTHAVCPTGRVADTAVLPERYEAYVVLAGRGELWRRLGPSEGITALRPGRWVEIPPGTEFQYRATDEADLVFLVVVLPTWTLESYKTIDGGPWSNHAGAQVPPTSERDVIAPWMSGDLPSALECLAPDGSEIRTMSNYADGSIAHCTLPPEQTSTAVYHERVHEAWYVVSGYGTLWRANERGAEDVRLHAGVFIDIPPRVEFQYRSTGLEPLSIVISTMPAWRGPGEAIPATRRRW